MRVQPLPRAPFEIPSEFVHSVSQPDFSYWPWDVPWIMFMVHGLGLEVNKQGTLDGLQKELDDMTERCRTAENRAWLAAKKFYEAT